MATASVGYPNGLTWMHQWFKTSQYLGRLRQIYGADPVNNIDLLAIVDGFMISCAHMWDAFKNDPGLPSITKADVEVAMKGDANLRLCRDYANTAKHLKRRGSSDIEAAVLVAGSTATATSSQLGLGPRLVPGTRLSMPWTWPTPPTLRGSSSWANLELRNPSPSRRRCSTRARADAAK